MTASPISRMATTGTSTDDAVSSTAGLFGEAITELLASADHEAKLLGRRGIVNRVNGGLSTAVDGPVSDVL